MTADARETTYNGIRNWAASLLAEPARPHHFDEAEAAIVSNIPPPVGGDPKPLKPGNPNASSVPWKFQGILLRTTYQQCTCGQRHTGTDVFQQYTRLTRTAGEPSLETSLVPYGKSRLPAEVELTHTTRIVSVACCHLCVERLRIALAPIPAISEDEWRQTLKRKEIQAAEEARRAKIRETKPKAVFSLRDIKIPTTSAPAAAAIEPEDETLDVIGVDE